MPHLGGQRAVQFGEHGPAHDLHPAARVVDDPVRAIPLLDPVDLGRKGRELGEHLEAVRQTRGRESRFANSPTYRGRLVRWLTHSMHSIARLRAFSLLKLNISGSSVSSKPQNCRHLFDVRYGSLIATRLFLALAAVERFAMKRFALLMSVLTLFAAQAWVFGASYEDAKGPKGSATAVKTEKNTEKKKTENRKTIPVPEPTTITLLGAAAGVAVARKLWRKRQRKLERQ
jgi:hypothetical protein